MISLTFVKSREDSFTMNGKEKKKIKKARHTATTKQKVILHFQRGTVVPRVDEFSGNFSFIYLQKTHRVVPDFTDSNPEVVFSFHFLSPKFMRLLHQTSSAGKDSDIPFLPVPFPLLPSPSSGRKVEHGEQSGVTSLPRTSLGSPEGLRGTRCG